ncbi:MAG TPA: hypothetical protein VN673_07710 [Clostridia bacterium]|nr:hypothetical protein [Clostridia bacterium]
MPTKVRIQIEGAPASFLRLLPETQFQVPIRIQPDRSAQLWFGRRRCYEPPASRLKLLMQAVEGS